MNPLIGVVIGGQEVALLVAILVIVVLVSRDIVRAFFKVDDRLEDLRRLAGELAKLFAANDMPHVATIATDASVGDLTAAIGHSKLLLAQMQDPRQAALLLENMFAAQLPKRLNDAKERGAVLKAFTDWIAANPDAAKAAGIAITVPPLV